ncbi:MAG: hypothetical protein HYX73_08620 [Acidobacteria bacterium]|nr:hypothetical protein [Acidobacteriota bacterium]
MIGRGMSKGSDYDRETGRVKFSSKEVIPDFIFPKLNLALEVKLASDSSRAKGVIDEVNADIRTYKKKFKFVLFVIYDIGSIRDESEFRRDLESEDGVSVLIIKH